MTREEAKGHIRNAVTSGCLWRTDHCREQMQRRCVDMEDIHQALVWGEVQSLELDPQHGNWKCEVNGPDLEDDTLTVQLAIDSVGNAVVVITVY